MLPNYTKTEQTDSVVLEKVTLAIHLITKENFQMSFRKSPIIILLFFTKLVLNLQTRCVIVIGENVSTMIWTIPTVPSIVSVTKIGPDSDVKVSLMYLYSIVFI